MPEANFNPYATPKADLSPPSGPGDRRGSPRRVPFWSGLRWLVRACGLVVRRPLSWLGALLLVEALTVAGSLLLLRLADAGRLATRLTGYGALVAWPGLWVLLAGGMARMVAAQGRGEPGHAFMIFAAFREKRLWPLALVVALYALALLVLLSTPLLSMGSDLSYITTDALSRTSTGLPYLAVMVAALLDDFAVFPASEAIQSMVCLLGLGSLAVTPALLATLLGPALTMPAGQRPDQAAAALLLACRKNALPLMMAWCLGLALFSGETLCMLLLPRLGELTAVCVALFNAHFFLWLIAGALAARDIFYQEQGAAPAKHAAWPAQEPRNPQDSSC